MTSTVVGECSRVACRDLHWKERVREERRVGENRESTCVLAARVRGDKITDTGHGWPSLLINCSLEGRTGKKVELTVMEQYVLKSDLPRQFINSQSLQLPRLLIEPLHMSQAHPPQSAHWLQR